MGLTKGECAFVDSPQDAACDEQGALHQIVRLLHHLFSKSPLAKYFGYRISHFLQNEEKLCLDATIEKLNELEYEVVDRICS